MGNKFLVSVPSLVQGTIILFLNYCSYFLRDFSTSSLAPLFLHLAIITIFRKLELQSCYFYSFNGFLFTLESKIQWPWATCVLTLVTFLTSSLLPLSPSSTHADISLPLAYESLFCCRALCILSPLPTPVHPVGLSLNMSLLPKASPELLSIN